MSTQPIRIVIADDDELDTRLTERAVEQAMPGATIVKCDNGEQALTEFQRMGTEGAPNLVFMDFKMPKMGCLDVLKALDQPDLIERIPVVLFSSSVGPGDVDRCLQQGIRAYVEKPTDPDQYNLAVADICRRFATVL